MASALQGAPCLGSRTSVEAGQASKCACGHNIQMSSSGPPRRPASQCVHAGCAQTWQSDLEQDSSPPPRAHFRHHHTLVCWRVGAYSRHNGTCTRRLPAHLQRVQAVVRHGEAQLDGACGAMGAGWGGTTGVQPEDTGLDLACQNDAGRSAGPCARCAPAQNLPGPQAILRCPPLQPYTAQQGNSSPSP